MSRKRSPAPTGAKPSVTSPSIQSATTFGSAIVDLFRVAQGQLTGEDLAALSSGLLGSAQLLSQNIATVCESTACMIGEGGQSGSFQGPDDVPELLFMIGTMNELISSAVFVGSDAEGLARERGVLSRTGRTVPSDLETATPEGSA